MVHRELSLHCQEEDRRKKKYVRNGGLARKAFANRQKTYDVTVR